MTQKITAKSTKAQILEAFDELEKEKIQLEKQVKKLSKAQGSETSSPPPKSTKMNENAAMKPPATPNQNITQTLQVLEKLQVGFGSSVSNLSEQLIAEATTLEDLNQKATEELELLQELHQLDGIEDDTLSTLIQTYEEENKTFDDEYSQQKETLEQEMKDLVTAWQKEQETHGVTIKERNENQATVNQRDETEYGYNLDLERELQLEESEQNKKGLYEELSEISQQQEKQWKEREEQIAKQEKEQTEAKEKVEAFDLELEAKIKKGEAEGKGIGTYQTKVKADLRTKEIEGEKRNHDLKSASLEQTIQTQEARLASLTQQLEAALKQVQDLAVKAIEGTSNRKSFEAMQTIAMEQAKNQPKGK
ncbi:MAG: hypothetical protein AB4058_20340 [Microcystaceae cyanobacterium]